MKSQDNLKRSMEIAREAKKQLSQQIPILDLHLLRLRARGDDTPESDLDIYIETVSLTRQQQQIISDILWEIGFEHGVVGAPVIFSREDIKNGPFFVSPIYRVVMREGIPV